MRGGPLPRHVRAFLRLSRRGLPSPECGVRLERGVPVPMPDRVTLLADHYWPQVTHPAPTVLVRCPYGRGFPYDWMYGGLLAAHGFHVLIQSCRGTAGSGGEFEPFVNEAADGQATVAWLREQDWFNGSLGTIGASYLGFTQWALAADPPPELKAMVIQVSSDDFYGFLYPGGAFALDATLVGVLGMLAQERGVGAFALAVLRLARRHRRVIRSLPFLGAYPAAVGATAPWFERWLAHPDAADPFWASRRAEPKLAAAPPVTLLGGWADVCVDPTLDAYQRLRAAGREVRLVVGPWNHTSGFDKDMPAVFGEALRWLRAHLLDGAGDGSDGTGGHGTGPGGTGDVGADGHGTGGETSGHGTSGETSGHGTGGETSGASGYGAGPPATPVLAWFGAAGSGVSTRGGGRASATAGWCDLTDWPPPGTRITEWRLTADRALLAPGRQASPARTAGTAGPAVGAFRYDPRAPTPSVGGVSMDSNGSGARRNDSLEARPDVLTFTGAPLEAVLEVAGPVSVRLRVRGSTPYFDVFARLCDVDPAGRSWNVCDGILRLGAARAAGGGSWAEITVPMSSTAHRFGAGHRVRLQLSGGAHPRFARNTGTGEPIATATEASLVAVDVEIATDPAGPGALFLPVTAG